MSEPIEVPESAFEYKPRFISYPTPALIREIKDYIRRTGTPHLWWGHTHSRPPQGGTVIYLDEFDVPTFGFKLDRVAPCPCCSPRNRKYKNGGKIAWFPDESVIRLIGPQCYKALNAEGHDIAEKDLRIRLASEKYAQYLIRQLPTLPAIIAASEEVAVMAEALDRFRDSIQRRVHVTLGMRLFDHIREGVLNRTIVSTEMVVDRSGHHRQRMVSVPKRYSSITGWQLMDPRAKNVAPGVRTQVERLRTLHADLAEMKDIRDTDDLGLRRHARAMSVGRKTIATAIERIAVEREFVSTMTFATLRNWGRLEDASLKASFDRRGDDLMIGFDPEHVVRVVIPEALERVLPTLPHLAEE